MYIRRLFLKAFQAFFGHLICNVFKLRLHARFQTNKSAPLPKKTTFWGCFFCCALDHRSAGSILKKQKEAKNLASFLLVELKGIEPSTYRLRTCRSPNWATTPFEFCLIYKIYFFANQAKFVKSDILCMSCLNQRLEKKQVEIYFIFATLFFQSEVWKDV